jgi:hypothetical protein
MKNPPGANIKSAPGQKPRYPPPNFSAATPAPAAPVVNGEKPTSLGGAMKLLIRSLVQPFTQDQLRAALDADKDFAKLLEEASASTFYSNLAYWSKTGKLAQTGDTYRNVAF